MIQASLRSARLYAGSSKARILMIRTDYLVLGSGIAGLIFALEVAEHGEVVVLCKNEPDEGSTRYAQGGIASVTSPLDTFQAHIADTLDAGDGLCNEEIVRLVVENGPSRIKHLIDLGTNFDREGASEDYELGREGGHSARRILHARDATGAEIHRAIYARASAHPNIDIRPFHIAIDFVTADNPDARGEKEVLGVYALDMTENQVTTFVAKLTLLATGGAGKVYLYTSNPDVATGDGIAMAFRAGARASNMEFFQFHPTCLFHPDAKSFLITEAMRGEGAVLTTRSGRRFMPEYDERAELAPRDIVARAIDREMKKTGDDFVYLDISHREDSFILDRFPTIAERTTELGFNLCKEPLPVVPAAHYCCGGVLSDSWGRTDLARLYVAGETAQTGLHGANRLASNSLLEALVFAHRAARHALSHKDDAELPTNIPEWDPLDTVESREEVLVSHSWDEVRRTMWNLVGISRSDKRLDLAKRRIQQIAAEVKDYYWSYQVTSDLIELRNIITVALITIHCASQRRESRGLHYNVDIPHHDDANWLIDSVVHASDISMV